MYLNFLSPATNCTFPGLSKILGSSSRIFLIYLSPWQYFKSISEDLQESIGSLHANIVHSFLQAKDVVLWDLQPIESLLKILVGRTLVEFYHIRFSSSYIIRKLFYKRLSNLIKLMISLYDDNLVVNFAKIKLQRKLINNLNYISTLKSLISARVSRSSRQARFSL